MTESATGGSSSSRDNRGERPVSAPAPATVADGQARIVRGEPRSSDAVERHRLSPAARALVEALEQGRGGQTIPELFFWRTRQNPEAEALRHKVGGSWRSISYRAWEQRVRALAAVLTDWVEPGEAVCIMSENRPEWTYADLATLCVGGVVAPIYPTDPPKDLAYVLNDAGAKTLFVSSEEQLAKVETLRAQGAGSQLQHVVIFDPTDRHVLPHPNPRSDQSEVEVVSLSSLLERGRELPPDVVEQRIATLEPTATMTLIYTSGTTGERKGVMLSHANIVGNVDNTVRHIGVEHFHDSVMLSFLPLSHSLERTCGYYVALRVGTVIAYAESIDRLPDNLLEVRPSILVSVPRVYEKVYAKIQATAADSLVKRRLLEWAMGIGGEVAEREVAGRPVGPWLRLQHLVADRLIFARLRERLGGRVRFACTGGAPMPREIAVFLRAARLLIIEGYGLTETSPVLTLNGPDEVRFGSVGRPIAGVELMIEPEPGCQPGEGEILARGPNVMRGYYGREEATFKVLTADGWFRTGDIGYLDDDGYLFITDRKKELLKTSGGKYVAPAPIEGRLSVHPLVEQSCVIGNRRKYCVVLIVPQREALAERLGRPLPEDFTQWATAPEVQAVYQELLDTVNEDRGRWEQLKRFALLPHELTQETGELTPTQKLKRRVIDEKYREVIDSLYPDE